MDKNLLKNVSVIGLGKLGLCFALGLERKGYSVVGVDIDRNYVKSLNNRSFDSKEPGVNEMLSSSLHFVASTEIKDSLLNRVIFLVVATPSLIDGRYDHSQIERVTDQLLSFGQQKEEKHLVVCCTTMPEYCDILQAKMTKYNYTVSYNPEFIAQGTIVHDQRNPDMILIGEASSRAGDLIEKIYIDMCDNTPRVCRMSRTEAEITKIALNCFLTTKIAYANLVGDIALRTGYLPTKILNAIGQDSRIGQKYLKWGHGFGGPCFPRDNRAFGIYAESKGIYPHISYSTDLANASHLREQFSNFLKTGQKSVTFHSVSYKPGSEILEESQQLRLAIMIADSGFEVLIEERPSVIDELKKKYGQKFIYKETAI